MIRSKLVIFSFQGNSYTATCDKVLELATLLTNKGDHQMSLDLLSLILLNYPNDPEILNISGKVCMKLNITDIAVKLFSKALTLDNENIDYYVDLADVYIALCNYQEAIVLLSEALNKQSDKYVLYPKLAYCNYMQGDYKNYCESLQTRCLKKQSCANIKTLGQLGLRFLAAEWVTSIGHLAIIDLYVKMKLLGWQRDEKTIILTHPIYPVANLCYLNYWRKYLPAVISDPVLLDYLSPVTICLEQHQHVFSFHDGSLIDIYPGCSVIQKHWESEKRPPLLALSDDDTEKGWNCLVSLGVPRNSWFVAIHVREGKYDGDRSVRNSKLSSYIHAINTITSRGGWVIRMGDSSMKPLPNIPCVIDYCRSPHKSDWMDVFLWAECRFFIGTSSGPAQVPPTFGVPCVLTNWSPPGVVHCYSQDIYIPKLFWSVCKNRLLTFSEALSSPVSYTESRSYLYSKRVEIVDNSSDEINDLVLEMLDRLEGGNNYSPEDLQLIEQFKNIEEQFNRYTYTKEGAYAQIGISFLRKYKQLLD